MAEEPEITLTPLTGWEIGTLPMGDVGCGLEFVRSEEELLSGVRHVQRFSMTATQADELAEMLRQAAARSRQRQTHEAGRA
jgi:hypothetical protein